MTPTYATDFRRPELVYWRLTLYLYSNGRWLRASDQTRPWYHAFTSTYGGS